MSQLQAIIEAIFYFTATFIISLSRIIFEKKRLWAISTEYRQRPKRKIDKKKFEKFMKRVTK